MIPESFIQATFVEVQRNLVMQKFLRDQEIYKMFGIPGHILFEKTAYATVDGKKVQIQYSPLFINKTLPVR